MNPRKWIPTLPLFGKPCCVYCGGPADSSDHTPPRCLLPRKLPNNVQAMTVPACRLCNQAFSADEQYVAAILCTVSFTQADRQDIAKGGRMHNAIQRDRRLKEFIDARLGADGVFRVDSAVIRAFSRVMQKTAAGLLFFEFGCLVHPDCLSLIALDHTRNISSEVLAELYRRDDGGWAEVTPSCRELERQVMASLGHAPPHTSKWQVYIPEVFEYVFLRRSDRTLLCGMKVHDALTVLLRCPWPSDAGPRRRGTPRSVRRSGKLQ